MYELIDQIAERVTWEYGQEGRRRVVVALNSFLDAILANHPADDIQIITHELAIIGVTANEREELVDIIDLLISPDDQKAMRAYIIRFAPSTVRRDIA
jgi:hypothetical protein